MSLSSPVCATVPRNRHELAPFCGNECIDAYVHACAYCAEALELTSLSLFCSVQCKDTAKVVRWSRRQLANKTFERPDVVVVMRTRLAFVLAGGYDARRRRLSAAQRVAVIERFHGACASCGQAANEVDHIKGSSSEEDNLQLLCRRCHQAKTEASFVPASPEDVAQLERIAEQWWAETPELLSLDEVRWDRVHRKLRSRRRRLLIDEIDDLGYCGTSYPVKEDEWRALAEDMLEMDALSGDDEPRTPDDDGGFGPGSYFAHAMAKDD